MTQCRGPLDDAAERTLRIAEHDLVLGRLDDEEPPIDGVLQTDITVGHLCRRHPADHATRGAELRFHLPPDIGSDLSHDGVGGCWTVFELDRLCELDNESSQERLLAESAARRGL